MRTILIAAVAALALQSATAFAQHISPDRVAQCRSWPGATDAQINSCIQEFEREACVTSIGEHWWRSMEQAAILYPRFGIAWTAQKQAIQAAAAQGDQAAQAAQAKAHEQFIDRMLRTAEPEAVQFYQMMEVAREQAVARCGTMPVAP